MQIVPPLRRCGETSASLTPHEPRRAPLHQPGLGQSDSLTTLWRGVRGLPLSGTCDDGVRGG